MSPNAPAREGRGLPALHLEPNRIIETIERLARRIDERFPGSGLSNLGQQLHLIATETKDNLDEIERPIWTLRIATGFVACVVLFGLGAAIYGLAMALPGGEVSAVDAVQLVESGIQDIVFAGFAVVFLVTAEDRRKRRRALGFLRELRAVAHIVDMHQLTKDPDQLIDAVRSTDSSPERTLTRDELGRYLDYCTEMLSLTSKLAALYAARFSDSVVLQAVDEVETLTTALASKMWQKIMMLDTSGGSSEQRNA